MTNVSLERLTFRHPGGFQLGPLHLEFPAATRTAVVGPSGSGKTTLLRLLAGLERPADGQILFRDEVVSDPSFLQPPHERKIGFVFQGGALWPHMTAMQHLRFVAPGTTDAQRLGLLQSVGLQDRADRRPAQLSGGEARRLALARALVGGTRILLLDEPLHSVDPHLCDELALLVRRLAEERGLTLIVVTHGRDDALAMADELVILRDGQVVEQGAVHELLARPRTAWTARFLCRAACLPASAGDNEQLKTPFGPAPRPVHSGRLALVILPGEVELCRKGEGPQARVLRLEAGPDGPLATVELGGQILHARCRVEPAPGSHVALRLTRAPRILPFDRPEEEAQP